MKKLLLLSLLLIIPQVSLGAFSVPMVATSTSQGWVAPARVNGTDQTIQAVSYQATSTTATSTFAGHVKVTGNLQVDGKLFAPLTIVSSGTITGSNFVGTGAADSSFVGNVGLGSTTPTARLSVNGSTSNTSAYNTIIADSANRSRFILRDDGLLGLGSGTGYAPVAPKGALHINAPNTTGFTTGFATNGGTLYLTETGNGPETVSGIELQNSGSGNGYGYKLYTNNATDYFGIATRYSSATWSEPFVIKQQTGNVGIGTTSPQAILHTYGASQLTAALSDSGTRAALIQADASNDVAGAGGGVVFSLLNRPLAGIKSLVTNGVGNFTGDLAFSTRNATSDTSLTERMRISYGGSVGIGTTSPASTLSVQGDMLVTGNTLRRQAGTAATVGNATLVAGTVTVSTTAAKANSYIMLTRKTSGGTIGTSITYTISAGTSFTITSDNILDTSTFSWLIIDGY